MAGRSAALSLYRSILRAHTNYLPPEMRQLGDAYVKSEFRLHKSATKGEQLDQFFSEWGKYLDQIQETGRARDTLSAGILDVSKEDGKSSGNFKFGSEIPRDIELSEEQLQQLKKLREEAHRAGSADVEK